MKCRSCGLPLEHTFVDLGYAPPSNDYLAKDDLTKAEIVYPLRVLVCGACWLVQTEDYTDAETLFHQDYAYFSSTSTTWLDHAARYCDAMTDLLGLNSSSFVIEVASNDGYLLKNFVAKGVPCLGIEPTHSTAVAAEALGIDVKREFFGAALGKRLMDNDQCADLIVGNNVYAHVPDINDFTLGLAASLKPEGVVTLEFPHLMQLIHQLQFDTIYHEHFSYLSLHAVLRIFAAAGLRMWRVDELPTHGGSVRVFGCLNGATWKTEPSVAALLDAEVEIGLCSLSTYQGFQSRVETIKDDLLLFLIEQKRRKRKVAAYGAAAKGNTMLNFAGVRSDLISFVCDAAPAKQGKFMPGSHIPILPPCTIDVEKPDYVLILPWNIADEVKEQLAHIREWGAQFVTAIPHVVVS
ncbi:class I SAM-dependent methyltransferase [Pseudolabrys sp.]|uniref:class I SAM-dependent methyltransferase n=1 Tax=Pseudolabrys sp. TaxID=1960880 RepID=UPI003D0D5609